MSKERNEQLVIRVEPRVCDYAQLAYEQTERNRVLMGWLNRSFSRKVLDVFGGKKLNLPPITVEAPNIVLADQIIGSDVQVTIKCPECQLGWTEPVLVPCSCGQGITRVFGFCKCCYAHVEADISFHLS